MSDQFFIDAVSGTLVAAVVVVPSVINGEGAKVLVESVAIGRAVREQVRRSHVSEDFAEAWPITGDSLGRVSER